MNTKGHIYRFLATGLIAITPWVLPLPVHAVTDPEFPSCTSITGTLIVSYPDGTHGIAGSTDTYTGSDSVYNVGEGLVTQCFCSVDGKGIQTDWWNASSLSQEQTAVLKSQGWFYIPDGNLWGLESGPYLAKNTQYSCLPGSTVPSNGGSSQGDGKSDGRSDGRSSCPKCTAPPQGQILAAETGQVLGLATTGNIVAVYATFILSFLLLGIGSKLLKRQ